MNNADISERMQEFKHDLSHLSPIDIARRHIVFGDCMVISSDKYFELRKTISDKYNVHPNEVIVVGSAKLGFSIAPEKRYQPFGDASDLDIAIVSPTLFESVWRDVHRYFLQGGYWEGRTEFIKYLFRGWIRPDRLPPDHHFPFARNWWEFFNLLSASRRYSYTRIRGAIYQSWYFLETYQTVAISQCVLEQQNTQESDNAD